MRTLLGSPSLDFMYISASAPDAPPLSDTTMGCFIRLFFWIAACIILAIWSEAPPAPAATTISTGLVGSQAKAGAAVRASFLGMCGIVLLLYLESALRAQAATRCFAGSRWHSIRYCIAACAPPC